MIKENISIIRGEFTKTMAHIEINPSLIKAALIKGYRIAVFFNHEETNVEYHFKQDPRDIPGHLSLVVCVMYTSTTSDPLRISGVTQSIKEFMKIFERPITYVNYKTPYKLVEVKIFPGDWYPCFEHNGTVRIAQVEKELPMMKDLAERIAEEDKKIVEDERKRLEEEKKRREEEYRKLEEARKNRDLSRARIANTLSSYPRPLSRLTLPPGAITGLTDSDISEMLAKGFFL